MAQSKTVQVGLFATVVMWTMVCGNSVSAQATRQADSATETDSECRIGDQLMISVWKEPELSSSVVVRKDGMITLPVLNDVRVVGLKPIEVQQLLNDKFRQYITDPQVTVIIQGRRIQGKPKHPPQPSPDLRQKCCVA